MTSPFDDPESRAQMEAAGVVHVPGMAADVMRELAPLLAADGIDLDDLGDRRLDDVNAALGRATERHNLALSTPVGAQRANAIAVLRAVAGAIAAGDEVRADAILATIDPDARGERPSVAHVTGVAAGTLDEWLGHPRAVSPSGAKFPAWPGDARQVATEMLGRARRGQAFDGLQQLTMRHGGRAVLWGAALAVAIAARARVTRERVTLDGLLPGGEAPAVPDVAGFEQWLEEMGVDDAADEARFLRSVGAAIPGLDLDDAESVGRIVETLLEGGLGVAEEMSETMLQVLVSYADYRSDIDDAPESWERVSALLDGPEPIEPAIVESAVRATETLSEAERLTALRATRPVGAVPALVEWLGSSRPVSQTGAVRRADIEHVARMLGLDARGVAKRPAFDGADETRYVTSMRELTELDAWWEALSTAEIIDIRRSTVVPGAHAAEVDLDTAELVLGAFIAELLAGQRAWWAVGYIATLEALVAMLSSDTASVERALENGWAMRMLVDSGIVVVDTSGASSIPPALRAVVARGIVLSNVITRLAD